MPLAYSGIVDADSRDGYCQTLFESLYNSDGSLYVGYADGSMNHSFICFTGVSLPQFASIYSGILTLNLIGAANTRLTDGMTITANRTASPSAPTTYSQYASISGNQTGNSATVYLGSGLTQNWTLNPVNIDVTPIFNELTALPEWNETPRNVLFFLKDSNVPEWIGGALRFEGSESVNNNPPTLTIQTNSEGGGGGGGGGSNTTYSGKFVLGVSHKSFSIINSYTLD